MLFFFGCTKDYEPINVTDLKYEIERDDFSDTLYFVRNFNLTSTNDSVLDNAKAVIIDKNDNIILEDHWKNIVNSTFGLPERRTYDLSIEIYREIEGNLIFDYKDSTELDNNDYPDYIKINSFEMDPACLDDNGVYSISNAHYTLVNIFNDLEYYFDEEEYSVDGEVTYLEKTFAPKTLNFNFNDLYLPTKSYDSEMWKYYAFWIRYPRLYSGVIYDTRDIVFKLSVEGEIEKGTIQAGTVYSAESDDDASNGGGLYFGVMKYEWIYE